MPSPSVPQNAIVSPETFSNHSSPTQSSQHLPTVPITSQPLPTPPPPPPLLSEAQSHPQLPKLPQDYHTTIAVESESALSSSIGTGGSKTHLGSSTTSSAGGPSTFQRVLTPTQSVKTPPSVVIIPGGGPGCSTTPSTSDAGGSRPAGPSGGPSPVAGPYHYQQRHQPGGSPLAQVATPSTTVATPAQHHLAVLYHSSHHHHLHPILNTTRRPSRLPEPIYYQQPREVKP